MIHDNLIYSFKNIKRNKKNLTLIIILSLLFILLYIDVIFFKNINGFINASINRNTGFRTITVTKESISYLEGLKELRKVEHISEVYIPSYDRYSIETDININGLDGELELLYGTSNITPKTIVGKQMNELESGEMICPFVFYPDSGSYDFKIDENKIILPEDSLNYEFDVFYLNVKMIDGKTVVDEERAVKKFKIVGLYDNKLIMNLNNQCYITPDDMKVLQDSLNPQTNYEDMDYTFARVVIDDTRNLDNVKKNLRNLGYDFGNSTSTSIDTDAVNKITLLTITLFIIIICTIFLLLLMNLNKKIKDEYKQIGILRACGYTKKQVINKQNVECLVILFISFIISLILFSILFILIKDNLFKFTYYIGYKVENNIIILIILSILITLISSFFNYLLLFKKIDTPIDNILKEE